jgi:MerR family transcriptional regulator, redox-sensitive transcriptional activator SoxR
MKERWLTVGETATRAGVATSALRFYESEGLIMSRRTEGGQRRYHASMLRRVAFIRVSQQLGIGLEEIGKALTSLPDERTPTRADWARLSKSWKSRLDEQIRSLVELRDELTSCIGCGCLSLQRCNLSNPNDRAAALGTGPRYLLGDDPDDLASPED